MSESLAIWYSSAKLTTRRRELLLLEGISLQGLGNWQAIAEHVGTRTKEEVEQHYKSVYIDSQDWPLPVCLVNTSKRTETYPFISL